MMQGNVSKWCDNISLFYAELAEKLHLPRIGKYNNDLLILQLNIFRSLNNLYAEISKTISRA